MSFIWIHIIYTWHYETDLTFSKDRTRLPSIHHYKFFYVWSQWMANNIECITSLCIIKSINNLCFRRIVLFWEYLSMIIKWKAHPVYSLFDLKKNPLSWTRYKHVLLNQTNSSALKVCKRNNRIGKTILEDGVSTSASLTSHLGKCI